MKTSIITNPTHIIKTAGKLLMSVLLISGTLGAKAQLNPFQAMYFQNPYQYNPAMAGMEQALRLNIGYRQQWSNFPGTPKTALFTADMQPARNVGIGLNVNDDQEGLIRQTRVMGSYAYHLPLNSENEKLSFGVSLGVNDAHIDYNKVSGDLTDQQIAQYNQLKAYVDGDFGMAYTNDKLTVSGALPNLKSVFFKASDQRFDADRLLFITAVSYKIDMKTADNSLTLEPLVAYRKVKGYKDIGDLGFNFTMNNYGIFLQGIYHTSQSMGLGVGLDQKSYLLNFSYNLETGVLSNYTRGAFEFGLKLRLFGNK
ncbi:PorP/SprF family type IX secretion system membrane protein [Mucilaginibacter mali]|uniref:PorP/SprF family type IX secretion system membrane protein n=1 Tax=Mucilaginibacter mali TaxID=2740462 RepID=A0A7D4Q943_9SPHI|nr:PorP/SprF family type IX secretion system membrane protein [Mucilaginibacter mali]QKJ31111.1 PorP/SprF family type IX secretion system membrane protein [Mucilaginibacter mali]